jgi:carbonic anhydrase/acetyltransferase-like protein (isoleucine patch superfamily)
MGSAEATSLREHCLGPLDGAPGYSFPDIDLLECLSGEDMRTRSDKLSVSGNLKGNRVYMARKQLCPHPIHLVFHGHATGNTIIVGENSELFGSMNIHGNDNTIAIGAGIRQWSMVNVRLWSSRQSLFWGAGTTSNGCEVVMQGDGSRITIGDDCMFANNIYVRNSDMHPMVDLRSGKCINPPADVRIEPHVWVGQEALILKGVTVGRGSIIGAKSLVNRSVRPYSLAAGTPARLSRANISWDRPEFPRADVVQSLSQDCFQADPM